MWIRPIPLDLSGFFVGWVWGSGTRLYVCVSGGSIEGATELPVILSKFITFIYALNLFATFAVFFMIT